MSFKKHSVFLMCSGIFSKYTCTHVRINWIRKHIKKRVKDGCILIVNKNESAANQIEKSINVPQGT